MEVTWLVTESGSRAAYGHVVGSPQAFPCEALCSLAGNSAVHDAGKASLCFTSLGKPWESYSKIKNAY